MLVRFLGDPGPQWVAVDIPYQFQQVAVGIHQDRFVPSPEQGAVAFVNGVEALSVDSVKMSHTTGEVPIRRLNQEVIMGRRQAVGGHLQIKHVRRFFQKVQKGNHVRPVGI